MLTLYQLIEALKNKGITNSLVLEAIKATPRHLFVEPSNKLDAYLDVALPIAANQTISQPYVVAKMTQLLIDNKHPRKILEIGTGSGYQAAILAHIIQEVYTIERIQILYEIAKKRFKQMDLVNIYTLLSDGCKGWPEQAPFDGIIVTAATPEVPPALLAQLADGGRMVIPVGESVKQQVLLVFERTGDTFKSSAYDPVIFVPLLPGIEKTL